MSEKRFILQNGLITDNLTGFNYSNLNELCKLLNQVNERADKNAEMNEQLRQELKQKQEEEKLYAREIVELNKTKNEMLNFKELGGDY